MSCSEYQFSMLRKRCICALISKITLSDIEMDYLRAKNSDLGVNCIDILGTNVLKVSLWCITSDVLTSDFKVPFWVTIEACSRGLRTI